jgi:hypothetical protein
VSDASSATPKPTKSEPWRTSRAKLAAHAKHHPGEKPPTALRRDHAAARLEAHIRRVVAGAPPLTPEQRDRLTVLLRPTPPAGGAG